MRSIRHVICFLTFIIAWTSAYAIDYRIGVNYSQPDLIITNTDKNTKGRIYSPGSSGANIGLFFPTNRDSNFDFFLNLDFFKFESDRQLIGDNNSEVNLGSKAVGNMLELVPGISYFLHFGQDSYLSIGLGYGIRYTTLNGNLYLTTGDVSSACALAIANNSVSGIKNACERHSFNKNIQTNSTVATIDLKLDNFLLRATNSISNIGSDNESRKHNTKQLDDHEYQLAVFNLTLSYIF